MKDGKRYVIRAPDGTYRYGILFLLLTGIANQFGLNDSFVETKKGKKDIENQNDERLSQMDEEL